MTMEKAFKVVLGNNPEFVAVKEGQLALTDTKLDFVHYDTTHDAFKPMVNGQAFDICEMAIVTLILAKLHGRPLHMLPAVMIGRLQQPFASVNAQVQMQGPADLAGKRIGVRSFAQTTVTWLRGILKCDHHADLDAAHWISFEDGHVPEVADPTERAPAGRKMAEMLYSGDLDIALGLKSDDPRARPLFAEPEAAAATWYATHSCVPVNHIVTVTEDMVENHLDVVAGFYRLLRQAKAQHPHTGPGPDPRPMGFAALRDPIALLLRYMSELGMLPRPMQVDDLIDPRIREAIGE